MAECSLFEGGGEGGGGVGGWRGTADLDPSDGIVSQV